MASTTSSVAMQNPTPLLPAEIWRHLFLDLCEPPELIHLWTSVRDVCHQFRGIIEEMFMSRWLKDVSITVRGRGNDFLYALQGIIANY